MKVEATTRVSDVVAEAPEAARIFEKRGIDFCCGGKRSLADWCTQKQLNVDEVIAELETVGLQGEQKDWRKESVEALIRHLLDTHHVYTRDQIQFLRPLADKVARVHGERHPELLRVRELTHALCDDLTPHLEKEERVLFPLILSRSEPSKYASPMGPGFPIGAPISVMNREHETVGAILKELRKITSNYTLPEGACMSYRALFGGLDAFEIDIHLHIHLEENVLFPKAKSLPS